MGRPPKDPAERATAELTVRFTEDERRRLDSEALHQRITPSELVRRAVREFLERLTK